MSYTIKIIRYLSFIISLSILLCGCKDNKVGKICIRQDNDKYLIYSNGYIYTLENGIAYDRRKLIVNSTDPALYILSSVSDYDITYLRENTYKSDYLSFCGYYNTLVKNGFKQVEYHSTSKYVDCVLEDYKGESVRIIYDVNGLLKIFSISLE